MTINSDSAFLCDTRRVNEIVIAYPAAVNFVDPASVEGTAYKTSPRKPMTPQQGQKLASSGPCAK